MAKHKDCEETADDASAYVGSNGESSDSEWDHEYDCWDAMSSKTQFLALVASLREAGVDMEEAVRSW